ncbi:MAG: DUF503 domain-containing protein [Clostridia bacterium]|nr:DUF503 domain-containing protein [Bacillota bacterium]MBO2520359.1 DUF503 domain-containing protein [Bacillota bacterium]
MDEGRLYLGLLTLDLATRACTSLKEKRRVLKGLIDRMKARLDVSVAEVGFQDAHQRARIAVACVGSDRGYVERTLQRAMGIAEGRDGAEVCQWRMEWR